MNHISSDLDPTPSNLTHGAVEWIAPPRYERREPTARHVGLHRSLADGGRITRAQYEWVERYVAETEIAAGAKLGKPEMERVDEWQGPKIYDRRTAAVGWLRLAHGKLKPRQRTLLDAACVHCYRVCDVAVAVGILPRDDETMGAFTNRVLARIHRFTVIAIEDGSGIQKKD